MIKEDSVRNSEDRQDKAEWHQAMTKEENCGSSLLREIIIGQDCVHGHGTWTFTFVKKRTWRSVKFWIQCY